MGCNHTHPDVNFFNLAIEAVGVTEITQDCPERRSCLEALQDIIMPQASEQHYTSATLTRKLFPTHANLSSGSLALDL